MQQVVLPIKDSNVLKEVQDTLLNNFKAGRRNYTIFQVGKATLLRVSDVMGAVIGYWDDQVYLQQKTGDVKALSTTDIRNVQLLNPDKWWALV